MGQTARQPSKHAGQKPGKVTRQGDSRIDKVSGTKATKKSSRTAKDIKAKTARAMGVKARGAKASGAKVRVSKTKINSELGEADRERREGELKKTASGKKGRTETEKAKESNQPTGGPANGAARKPGRGQSTGGKKSGMAKQQTSSVGVATGVRAEEATPVLAPRARTFQEIRLVVEKLLQGVAHDLPTDLATLTKQYNIEVKRKGVAPTSARLVQTHAGKAVILIDEGLNEREQRFALAHALGHYFLKHGNTDDTVEAYKRTVEQLESVEANFFALNILLPEAEIKRCIVNRIATDSDGLSRLFMVSETALMTQLYYLGYIKTLRTRAPEQKDKPEAGQGQASATGQNSGNQGSGDQDGE